MLHWSNTMQLIEEPKYTAPKERKGGGGGGATLQSFIQGGSATRSNPLPAFIFHF